MDQKKCEGALPPIKNDAEVRVLVEIAQLYLKCARLKEELLAERSLANAARGDLFVFIGEIREWVREGMDPTQVPHGYFGTPEYVRALVKRGIKRRRQRRKPQAG
jgi:hypothetical protein